MELAVSCRCRARREVAHRLLESRATVPARRMRRAVSKAIMRPLLLAVSVWALSAASAAAEVGVVYSCTASAATISHSLTGDVSPTRAFGIAVAAGYGSR